jgi:hypothetical protein
VTTDPLRALVLGELLQPAPAAATALASHLARRGGPECAAVLYYGSALRAGDLSGVLDFYVLLDDVRAWPGSWFARQANRLLPPNVGYLEFVHDGQTLRAKFAVMGLGQFARRAAGNGADTTIWARFCQPALLAWSRTPADRDAVAGMVTDAVQCAATWAARLGPDAGTAADYWRALFARTYSAELRVETQSRSLDIVGKAPARYASMLPLAWKRAGIDYHAAGEVLEPRVSGRENAARRWRRRARLGRPLNLLRLLKASFTFDGAMDYAAWKIERHSGVHIEVAPWQRRFPLLAAPGLYLKLRRRGLLRGGQPRN